MMALQLLKRRHQRRQASGDWVPPDLSNLVGWWKADAITGLANNDPVSQWNDSHTSGNNVSQGTASKKPTYKTNWQNGLPGVYFDGGDLLALDSVAANFAGEDKTMTCIAVAKRDVLASQDYFVTCGGTANKPIIFGLSYESNNNLALYRRDDAGFGYVATAAVGDTTSMHIASAVFRPTTASSFFNGVVAHDNVAQDFGQITLNTFSLGVWMHDGVPEQYTVGSLCEVLLWKSALSDADRESVEARLAAKWGITI